MAKMLLATNTIDKAIIHYIITRPVMYDKTKRGESQFIFPASQGLNYLA